MILLDPTRFVVDATETRNERDVATDVSSSQPRILSEIKRQHIVTLTRVTKMKSLSYGESLNVVKPTPPTTHPRVFVKRCASAKNPCKVDGWVYSRLEVVGQQVRKIIHTR